MKGLDPLNRLGFSRSGKVGLCFFGKMIFRRVNFEMYIRSDWVFSTQRIGIVFFRHTNFFRLAKSRATWRVLQPGFFRLAKSKRRLSESGSEVGEDITMVNIFKKSLNIKKQPR